MIDVDLLRRAISSFEFRSRPSNADGSAMCSNDDLNKAIRNIANVLNLIVDEIENEQLRD